MKLPGKRRKRDRPREGGRAPSFPPSFLRWARKLEVGQETGRIWCSLGSTPSSASQTERRPIIPIIHSPKAKMGKEGRKEGRKEKHPRARESSRRCLQSLKQLSFSYLKSSGEGEQAGLILVVVASQLCFLFASPFRFHLDQARTLQINEGVGEICGWFI